MKLLLKLTTDFIACCFGFSLVNIVPIFFNSGMSNSLLVDLTQLVQLMAGIAGLIYLIIRTFDLYYTLKNKKIINKLENKIKYEEGLKMERENFHSKWDKEFLKDK